MSGEKDFGENRDKEFLVDKKMRIIDALTPAEKEKAVRDRLWMKKNAGGGRVFMQQVPDSDVPNTDDWEKAQYNEYMKKNANFNKQDFNRQLERDLIKRKLK